MRTLGFALFAVLIVASCKQAPVEEAPEGTEVTESSETAEATETEEMTEAEADDGWTVLFGGESLEGWTPTENVASWSVEDGKLKAHGDRSHLYYTGDPEPFVNFELEAVVMTTPGSNSGIYFHTKLQEKGWPKYGFECQVNTSHGDVQKTGGLYGVEGAKVLEAPAKDNEWFTMVIRVEGKHAVVQVDGKTVTDYTEPEGTVAGTDFTRVFDEGTFALQAHDPKSIVYYKSIRVRRL